MQASYWYKQNINEPLYQDLLWSRPENKALAGKLLIVGGNAQGFAAAAEAYNYANKAGIGTARVLLPDALRKTIGRVFEAGEYAPSTPSGSFGQQALAELLAMANWADATLLAGDLGRNSETAILLEKFLSKHPGLIVLTKDAADYVIAQPKLIAGRSETTLVVSFSQLQKLAVNLGYPKAFTFDMNLLNFVDLLQEFADAQSYSIVTKLHDTIFVAAKSKVGSTKLSQDQEIWRLQMASYASVWQLQHPSKTFESLITGVYQMFTNK